MNKGRRARCAMGMVAAALLLAATVRGQEAPPPPSGTAGQTGTSGRTDSAGGTGQAEGTIAPARTSSPARVRATGNAGGQGVASAGNTDAQAADATACTIPARPIDRNHRLGLEKLPPQLRPDEDIDIRVAPAVASPEQIRAACIDSAPATIWVADRSNFTLTIPRNPASADHSWPAGDHVLSLQIGNSTVRQVLKASVALHSVHALRMRAGDNTFRVVFTGEGFDTANPTNNTIRIVLGPGLTVDENVCWSDADCNLKNSKLRGEIKSRNEIIVPNLDPMDERGHSFQVCTSGVCTDPPVTDSEVRYLFLAPVVSLSVALLLVLGVVLLAWQLKPIIIDGQRYLLSILFLDKETNSYSLSKMQFYIWTFVATFGYLALTISRNFFQNAPGLPPIPAGLPGIVAVAAGTAVGAQLVTKINGPKGAGHLRPSLADFVTTGEVVAAERVQFLVWTIVGACSFFAIVWAADPRAMTELPQVPVSLLSISGLSAVGYLGGKLARNPGPIITEVVAKIGTDPDLPCPEAAAPGMTVSAPAVPPAPAGAFVEARSKLFEARSTLGQVTTSAAVQPVLDAGNRACDAADQAIAAAAAGQASSAQTWSEEAGAQAMAAATAARPLRAGTVDGDNALRAGSAAQKAAQAAQAAVGAMVPPGAAQPKLPSGTAGSQKPVGLLEIRGRNLSRDATFRVSRGAEAGQGDVDLSFDLLLAKPCEPDRIKRPRIIEPDSDAKDASVAKRLLLVVNVAEARLAGLFETKSTHTLSIINPDSQKAMLKYTVPESQKPS